MASFGFASPPRGDRARAALHVALIVLLAAGLVAGRRRATPNEPPRIVSGEPAFTKSVLDDQVGDTHFALGADFDGDGDTDVVATDYAAGRVLWYESDDNGGFTRHVLDSDLLGAYPAHVADLDQDGDVDVLAGGYDADALVWYENGGSGGFTRRDIDLAADGIHSMVVADLDEDGDRDLLTTNQDAGTVVWYENDGSEGFTSSVIDSGASKAKRAVFGDFDGDGDLDVLAASTGIDEVAWHENDGSEGFSKHVIDAGAKGAYSVFARDLDADGDVDGLAASRVDDSVAWYENDGSGAFTKRVIDSNAEAARAVHAADVDADGRPDVLSASVADDTIGWYRNEGGGSFAGRAVDTAAAGAYGVFPVDMDRDGDVDVLSASRDSNEVAVHDQSRHHEASLGVGESLLLDSSRLQATDAESGPERLHYLVDEAPSAGELLLDGTPLAAGDSFTQQEVDEGRVRYAHGGGTEAFDGFEFRVSDGGGENVRPPDGDMRFTISGNLDESTLVWLRLDEGSGTVATDASGNGNDGVLVNGPVYEADTADGSPYALRLDGVDDFVDLGALDVEGSGLTLAAWMKPASFPGGARDPRLVSKATGVQADEHVFMLSAIAEDGATRLRARVRTGGSTTTLIASSGDLALDVWQHAALTYDGATLRLYLDGAEVGSTPLTGAVDTDPAIPVAVGSQPPDAGGKHFDGLLDAVRIEQRGLDASEIAELAAGG